MTDMMPPTSLSWFHVVTGNVRRLPRIYGAFILLWYRDELFDDSRRVISRISIQWDVVLKELDIMLLLLRRYDRVMIVAPASSFVRGCEATYDELAYTALFRVAERYGFICAKPTCDYIPLSIRQMCGLNDMRLSYVLSRLLLMDEHLRVVDVASVLRELGDGASDDRLMRDLKLEDVWSVSDWSWAFEGRLERGLRMLFSYRNTDSVGRGKFKALCHRVRRTLSTYIPRGAFYQSLNAPQVHDTIDLCDEPLIFRPPKRSRADAELTDSASESSSADVTVHHPSAPAAEAPGTPLPQQAPRPLSLTPLTRTNTTQRRGCSPVLTALLRRPGRLGARRATLRMAKNHWWTRRVPSTHMKWTGVRPLRLVQ